MAATRLGVRYGRDAPFTSIPPRPRRVLDIHESNWERWEIYRRYHYLTHGLNHAARCFELFEGDIPVAFMAVLHQPTKQRLDLKRVSRLVVLPDYQGIGIGRAFLDTVAAKYVSEGHMFEIKTSAKNLIHSLRGNPEWRLSGYGFSHAGGGDIKSGETRHDTDGLQDGDLQAGTRPFRGAWAMHDYGIQHRPTRGNLYGNESRGGLRLDCKVATFRCV